MKKLAIILTAIIVIITNTDVMAQHNITQTAGRTVLGDFAPKFAELNDDVLFGEPNTAYVRYFQGNSYLARISDSQIPFSNVTFEPGCRNHWHIYRATSGGGQSVRSTRSFSISLNSGRISSFVRGISSMSCCKGNKLLTYRCYVCFLK